MALKPYEEFAPGPLVFQIKADGPKYVVPEISWDDGLKLRDLLENPSEATPDEQNRLLLGAVYDEMVADNVPALALSRAVLTALSDFRLGREVAEQVWESGLSPEALAPKTGAASTSTGEATTTPTPASTTGTTSPKATSKAKRARASK